MKYRFEITYSTQHMKKACELMRKMDFSFEEIGFKHTIVFNCDAERSIEELKGTICQAYEFADCTVLHIEGGKIE